MLASLAEQAHTPLEVIVVDDSSSDGTAAVARAHGARVIQVDGRRFAGGARNAGWEVATGELIVFLDADATPAADWSVAILNAADEFPGAIIGCARTFSADSAWGWVAHLQVESPYLARGAPRDVPFVSAFCMALPRAVRLRWDESYGGEDAFFLADARNAGVRVVFDPRIVAAHEHERSTFADLRGQQRRLAYGLARATRAGLLPRNRRFFTRVPLHYLLLLRLPGIYRRLAPDAELQRRFVSLLPRLAVAEWTLGASALRYALAPPSPRGGPQPTFE